MLVQIKTNLNANSTNFTEFKFCRKKFNIPISYYQVGLALVALTINVIECRNMTVPVSALHRHIYLLFVMFFVNKCLCSGLEALIRAKYEQKKYIDKDWVAPQMSVSAYLLTGFCFIVT